MNKVEKDVSKGENLAALRDAIIMQFALGIFSSLLLDCGQMGRFWCFSMGIYWVLAIMILVRSRTRPGKYDTLILRWAFPVLLVVVFPAAYRLVWIIAVLSG